MTNNEIRILHCVNKMDRAGLETMIMNYYRNIDREKCQFDFLTHRKDSGAYDEEIKKMGGRIFHAPRLVPGNYIKYFKYMKKFFREHPEYKIVHSHIDTMSFFPLLAAKKSDIKLRISHSHTSKLDFDFKFPIKFLAKKLLPKVANCYMACGKKAAKFLYKKRKNVIFVNNAIDLNRFKFCEENRKKVRKELRIDENAIVIGHIGRYIYIKNQMFLIDLIAELLKNDNRYILILVGSGNDEQLLKDKAMKLGIEKKIFFIKDCNDVQKYYSAFDLFLMPSLFEGLPLVGIEAQANGLTSLFSDKISNEIIICKQSYSFKLKDGINNCINILNKVSISRDETAIDLLNEKGYNIQIEAKKLQDFYLQQYDKLENKKGD